MLIWQRNRLTVANAVLSLVTLASAVAQQPQKDAQQPGKSDDWKKQLINATFPTIRQVYLNQFGVLRGTEFSWVTITKDEQAHREPVGYRVGGLLTKAYLGTTARVVDVVKGRETLELIVQLDSGELAYSTFVPRIALPDFDLRDQINELASLMLVADQAVADEKERAAKEARDQRMHEERQRLEECHEAYIRTSDKKVSDLTVREEQLVRACQSLGIYK